MRREGEWDGSLDSDYDVDEMIWKEITETGDELEELMRKQREVEEFVEESRALARESGRHVHYRDELSYRARCSGGKLTSKTHEPSFSQTNKVSDAMASDMAQRTYSLSRSYADGPIGSLPDEVLVEILAHLPTPDLKNASETCARWFFACRRQLSTLIEKFSAHSPLHLNDEQYAVYAAVVYQRKNVFFTGKAGTGKSHLLKIIISGLDRTGVAAQVCAPCGSAAQSLGGSTLHEFIGLGIHMHSQKELKAMSNEVDGQNANVHHPGVVRARAVSVLVIDEVSMVSPAMWIYLDLVLRCFRKSKHPFGGLQIVCAGDFMQLKPVPEKSDQHDGNEFGESSHKPAKTGPTYCFETMLWNRVFGDTCDPKNPRVFYLTTAMRQSRDRIFLGILDRFRACVPTQRDREVLQLRSSRFLDVRKEPFGPSLTIVPHKKTAVDANSNGLRAIVGERSVKFFAKDEVFLPEMNDVAARQFSHCQVPSRFELKRGARVMLLRNYPAHQLSNGATGTVRELWTDDSGPDRMELALCLESDPNASLLRANPSAKFFLLGDLRFECVHYRDGNRVMYSETPVSRNPRSANFLQSIEAASPDEIELHTQARRRVNCSGGHRCISSSSEKCFQFPVVEFDRHPNRYYLVMPCTTDFYVRTFECINPKAPPGTKPIHRVVYLKTASRTQVPLDLAYASTVHKSQGMTLERATLSLSAAWDPSQVYVSLSRVRRMSDLRIVGSLPYEICQPHRIDRALLSLNAALETRAALVRAEYSKRYGLAAPTLPPPEPSVPPSEIAAAARFARPTFSGPPIIKRHRPVSPSDLAASPPKRLETPSNTTRSAEEPETKKQKTDRDDPVDLGSQTQM